MDGHRVMSYRNVHTVGGCSSYIPIHSKTYSHLVGTGMAPCSILYVHWVKPAYYMCLDAVATPTYRLLLLCVLVATYSYCICFLLFLYICFQLDLK